MMPVDGALHHTSLNESKLDLVLPADSADGHARLKAMDAWAGARRTPTSLVSYRSQGDLLIIGPEPYSISQAETLCDRLRCTVLAVWWPETETAVAPIRSGTLQRPYDIVRAKLLDLKGHLGGFTVTVSAGQQAVGLAEILGRKREHFDLVLDLQRTPQLRSELVPPGYYAPGSDAEALHRAVAEIPDMVGEFEKPKYFHYNPDICAHARRGLTGCTRCLDACPTGAITALGDGVEVDSYLCQGGGSCAAVCPTGAMTYAYPPVDNLLSAIRALLQSYREAGGKHACLLFHDAEAGRDWLTRIAPGMPESVLPLEIEEIGSVGLDGWLTALAYGARQVTVLCPPGVPDSVQQSLKVQLSYARGILDGLGYGSERVRLLAASQDVDPRDWFPPTGQDSEFAPAGFAPVNEKRTLMRLALDHLYEKASNPQPTAPLPAGAPFGEVRVNREACTLCMGCVAVCPASALVAGDELPRLSFIEWNCVQCGLCEAACPEDAIRLAARVILEPASRRETRTLNEEQPFRCVVCGKPFATQSVVSKIREKLKGHWMFQTPEAMRRMEMCEDCRVKDMFRDGGGTLDLHDRQ